MNMEAYDANLILGFKTVRLHQTNWTGWDAANFLREHYPCTRVLINYQTNLTHQYNSFKRTFDHAEGEEYDGPSMEDLMRINEFQEVLHSQLKGLSKLIDLDLWSKDVGILNDVVDWLGFDKCRFQEVMHENNMGYATDNETSLRVGDDCSYPFV